MSGERAALSAYQKPPVSNSVEVTGPVLNKRYWRPAQTVRCGSRDAVVGVVAGAFADGVEIEVVLEVAPHSGKIVNDRNAGALQRVRRPDAGELQEARRADRAAAHDHLAIGAQDFGAACGRDGHADRPALLDFDLERLRVEPHGRGSGALAPA